MRTLASFISVLIVAVSLQASEPGLFRFPAISRDSIAFVYADQVWVVGRNGVAARRLTNVAGPKSNLRFSPDGRHIAFTGNLEGVSGNIFVVPVGGGDLRQVTHLPFTSVLCQWTQKDELLFYTNSLSFARIEMQLFTVAASGGMPARLPLAFGAEGAIDDRGEWLAYTPHWRTPLTRAWKRYRGGAAQDVWLLNLRTRQSRRVTEWAGTDGLPMWDGNVLYYASDGGPERRINLWSLDPATNTRTQLTSDARYDLHNPSVGKGEIIFERGGDLVVLDVRTRRTRTVRVTIPPSERPAMQRRIDAGRFVTHRALSPDGTAVLLEARGDLWIKRLDDPVPKNLTTTSGVFEREAAWSPDGKWIAYASDGSGEYELYVRPTAAGSPTQLTHFGGGFRYRPVWSPDSKRLAFTDQTGAFLLCDVDTGAVREIDRDPWGAQQPNVAWSFDGQRIAYTKTEANRLTSIWLYETATGTKARLTSGTFNDSAPAFDRTSERLYFISERSFATPVFDRLASSVAYTAMSVLVSMPLAPGVTEVERHAIQIPASRGSLVSLAVTADNSPMYGFVTAGGERSVRLVREGKELVVAEGTSAFQLAHDGRKVLVILGDKSFVTEPARRPAPETIVDTNGMAVDINLRAEWRQIYADVWRLYRDFFYDPTMHGVDWKAVRAQYSTLLERASTRDELNFVLAELIGEVSVGHAYIALAGDIAPLPVRAVGMLGVDFALENGAYRMTRIYEGAPSDLNNRSPLRRDGNDVREGEYLLAVNGVPVDVTKDPWAAFDGMADREVTITVSARPVRDASSRDLKVKSLVNESNLRYRAWVEENRRTVADRSGGRIGYLHVTDFTANAVGEFLRQLEWQTDKDALIFDTRWSQGGAQPVVMAEMLARRPLNFIADRYSSEPWPTPRRGAHFGPKAVLVNPFVHSAGENFLYYFRKLRAGTIIGTRTWGGLVGLNGNPALIDSGYVNVPNAPFYDTEGWLIEGYGVDPDVVVEDDPVRPDSVDPQLLAAIERLKREVQERGYRPPPRPRYDR